MYFRYPGLGSTSGTVESTVGTAAGIAATLSKLSDATGPAAPFFEIAAGVAALLGALGVGSGCGQTCIVASDYANKAEIQMKANLAAWQALPPVSRRKASKRSRCLITISFGMGLSARAPIRRLATRASDVSRIGIAAVSFLGPCGIATHWPTPQWLMTRRRRARPLQR